MLGARRPPVRHQLFADGLGGVADDHPSGAVVDGDRGGGVAAPQLVERVAFPRLPLAAVVGQLNDRQPVDQPAEHPADVDLGQLVVVADQDELCAAPLGVVEEAGELAGAHHAGLVDDEDAAVREATCRAGAVEGGQQRVDGVAVDPGAGVQLGGGAGGERAADHADAAGLPGVAGGVEREGLARASLADHDLHARTEVASRRTIAACSPAIDGRLASASSTACSTATATPASCRPVAPATTPCSSASSSGVE